jgi:hypothetical protein
MDPVSLRRRIARAPRVPSNQRYGRVGLQLPSGSRSSDVDEDEANSSNDLELRQPAGAAQPPPPVSTVVASVFDIIVENAAGSTVTVATLPSLPTAGTVLSFPFGPLTVPSLRIQGGSVVPVSASNTASGSSRSTPKSTSAYPTSTTPGHASTSPRSSHGPFSTISGALNGTSASTTESHASTHLSTSSHSLIPSATQNSTSSITPTTFHTSTRSSLRSSSSGFGILATPTTGGSGAGSSTGSGPAASSTNAAAAAPASQVNTPTVVGGVVGGVAGFAVFLALIMLFARWRKHHSEGTRELRSNPDTPQRPDTGRSDVAMAEASGAPWGAAGAAAGTSRDNPFADPPQERGFQKLGGRKLESVLVSGGDGYGEPAQRRGGQNVFSTADSSFYRDSQGNYGGPASTTSSVYQPPRELDATPAAGAAGAPSVPPVPDRRYPGLLSSSPGGGSSPSPPPDLSTSPPDVVMMRPGPARQAVHTPAYSTPPQSPTERLRTDAIGRSHPSFDGSRGSRGSKFAEDLG